MKDMGKLATTILQVIAYIVAILVIWKGTTALSGIPAIVLPPPDVVLGSILRFPSFYAFHSVVTAYEAALGLALGTICGFGLAIVLHYSPSVARVCMPVVVALQVFPKEALAPLLIVVLGLGIGPKIFISAMICFFPVIVNTLRGFGSVPIGQLELFKSLGATEMRTFLTCRLPFASRYLMAALRLCATLAVVGAVVGEFSGSSAGLGHVIRAASNDLGTDRIYAAVILLGFVGFALYGLVVISDQILA